MTAATAQSAPLAAPPDVPKRRARVYLATALRVLLVALAVAAAVGIILRYRSTHVATPVRYETATVDRGAIAAKVTATGALSSLVTVSVGAQVSGRIEKLMVDFESPVKRNQIVATIEPSLFQAAVAQARANYDAAISAVEKARAQDRQAQKDFARAKGLLAASLMSQAEFDAAEANVGVASAQVASAQSGVKQARAALGQAELNLTYCTVRSPIDGVVISRNVDVGQSVAATLQTPTLFTIAQDLTRMQVDTNVAEGDIGKIRAGMKVTFTVDAYPTKTFEGLVRQVRDNAQTIQNVVTYDAVIDVDNSQRLLKPSMTANVTFIYATREAALRVPNAALRFKPDAATIAIMTGAPKGTTRAQPNDAQHDERIAWVLREGHASRMKVRIGIGDGETTELLGGDLHEGDAVITEANVDPSAMKKGLAMSAVIVADDLVKLYRLGDTNLNALDHVSVTIEEGELTAIMGASGSGKSTLMNVLGCLDRPTSGRYILAGRDVSRLGRSELAEVRNRMLGFVFQSFNLLARTTARENVELPLVYAGVARRERQERARAALERVGLGARVDHHPSQLSGGQQQRVAIARAIVNQPKIVLADEPTGNLDSKTSDDVMALFQGLWRSGLTIVFVTHEPDVAAYASRVITMRDGRVLSDVKQTPRIAGAVRVEPQKAA